MSPVRADRRKEVQPGTALCPCLQTSGLGSLLCLGLLSLHFAPLIIEVADARFILHQVTIPALLFRVLHKKMRSLMPSLVCLSLACLCSFSTLCWGHWGHLSSRLSGLQRTVTEMTDGKTHSGFTIPVTSKVSAGPVCRVHSQACP